MKRNDPVFKLQRNKKFHLSFQKIIKFCEDLTLGATIAIVSIITEEEKIECSGCKV